MRDLELYIIESKLQIKKLLKRLTRNHEKLYVCLSFFTSQFIEIKNFINRIKEIHKNKIKIIAGGPHPTGAPLSTLNMGCDYVVNGEGEKSFIEVLSNIKLNQNFDSVKGLSYINEEGQYRYTGKQAPINLDDYLSFPTKQYKRFGPIEITRGCPYACFFCQTPFIFGTRPQHRSIESVAEHVQILISQFKDSTDIRFISPNAFSYGSKDGININPDKIKELLSTVKTLLPTSGRIFFGSFPTEVRPEHVNNSTVSLITKYASNDNLVIGAQSGSQNLLDACNRNHTIEDVYNAVGLTIKAKLKAYVDFIFGLPGETEEDVNHSIKMMKELVKKGAKIHAHFFMPLPQTAFANRIPQKMEKKLIKVIETLTSNGNLFGSWKKQQKMAIKYSKTISNLESLKN